MSRSDELMQGQAAVVLASPWKFWISDDERFEAAWKLQMMGGPPATDLPRLIEAIEKRPPFARLYTLLVAAGGALNIMAFPFFEDGDKGTAQEVQVWCVEVRRRIEQAYRTSTDHTENRIAALLALQLDTPGTSEAATTSLRRVAALLLAHAGPRAAVAREKLELACRAPDPQVAIAAKTAVANITREGDGVPSELLDAMCNQRSDGELASLASKLMYIAYGIDRAPFIPDLLEIVLRGHDEARLMSAQTVGVVLSGRPLADPAVQLALPLLLEALLSSSDDLSSSLAGVFQTFGESALPLLRETMEDETKNMRSRVRIAGAIGLLGPIAAEATKGLEALRKELRDEHDREVVSEALTRVRPDAAQS